MNEKQIMIIEETFSRVLEIQDTAAELFYEKLFELDPELKPLFRGDMKEQGRKLMSALNAAVGSLKNPEKIIPVLEQMAVRHVSYGVEEEHYATVGNALISTLEKGLGDLFTQEAKEAWVSVYDLVSGVMVCAAKKAKVT